MIRNTYYFLFIWISCFQIVFFGCPIQAAENHHFEKTKGAASSYIDMGILYGHVQGNAIIWWPEPVHIDQSKLNQILRPLFAELSANNIRQIDLAFTQIQDIEALLNGKSGSATDTLTPILKENYPVGLTGQNFLQYLIRFAHKHHVKVKLSFGGVIAADADWKIQGDPVTQAQNLAMFLSSYELDGADFDIESNALMQVNKPTDVVTFFTTLRNLSPESDLTLTVMGDVNYWVKNSLKLLFLDLDQMFNGVNLMLYSNTHYYVDADNPAWGIKQWLAHVPHSNYLHIGFYDSIAYENPLSSAGEKYNVSHLTRGQAAARIYLDLLEELDMTTDQFGAPFWWTDNPLKIAKSSVFSDFYHYLSAEK